MRGHVIRTYLVSRLFYEADRRPRLAALPENRPRRNHGAPVCVPLECSVAGILILVPGQAGAASRQNLPGGPIARLLTDGVGRRSRGLLHDEKRAWPRSCCRASSKTRSARSWSGDETASRPAAAASARTRARPGRSGGCNVVPEFRRRGISRAILKTLEAEARRFGYTALRLYTGPQQPEIHRPVREVRRTGRSHATATGRPSAAVCASRSSSAGQLGLPRSFFHRGEIRNDKFLHRRRLRRRSF